MPCERALMHNRDIILRIVVLALMLYSLVSLASARAELRHAEETAAGLQQELALLEQEKARLEEKLASAGSDEEMLMLARERLGLVLPGEKIFYFTTDREEALWGWK